MKVGVGDGRGRRIACMCYGLVPVVKLPRWARSQLVILHELAHVMTPQRYAWHGPEFCRNFLALVARWQGKEVAAELKAAYKENRVKFRG